MILLVVFVRLYVTIVTILKYNIYLNESASHNVHVATRPIIQEVICLNQSAAGTEVFTACKMSDC